jgi:signal transduction histidine kinase
MTGFGKLLRTTAFKLAFAYLFFFAATAFLALGYLAWNANRVLDLESAGAVEAEVRGLAEQYNNGGIRGLAEIIERRSQLPGASLYLLASPQGETLAGNVVDLAAGVLDRAGAREAHYRRSDDPEGPSRLAIFRVFVVENGFRVVVGRDLVERERLRFAIRRTFGWSLGVIVILGGLGALFIARRVLRRVDAMSDSATSIMAGNLERRLPIAGTGDELDRLAASLNSMLDRIGELMHGMKEVSDNIAHDLRTPLTRLRNRAEAALRDASDPDALRRALEETIESADHLMSVFNALLTIARLEAGNAAVPMQPFDAGDVAREIADLYEPIAEESGGRLVLTAADDLTVNGNRGLVGQALANLIDNALKYGRQDSDASGSTPSSVTLTAERRQDRIALVVADRGPGIPEADRELVRERFARLEAARTKPGFGLGLALASAVARLHGGALQLDDNRPGLVATLLLPVQRGHA